MAKSPTSQLGTMFRRFSLLAKNDGDNKRNPFRLSRKHSSSVSKQEKITTKIPLMPCSVLQIKEYIQSENLKEAYGNLLSMRLQLRKAQNEGAFDATLVNKEKDIKMLFETLRSKISDIVRSSALSCHDKELLEYAAHIITEEETIQGEPGALQGWRESWMDAVRDEVRDTLENVYLGSREQNIFCLGVHLGLLSKTVVEDLEKVKTELVSSYPPEFNVFETYVSCHHETVAEHLKKLLEEVTELKDYHALLDFAFLRYPSLFKAHSDAADNGVPIMDEDLLNKIKTAYCQRQKDDFKSALENIIRNEKEVWKIKKTPDQTDDGFLTSKIHMNICQLIASYAEDLKENEDMEKSAIHFCLEELSSFHERFEEEFSQNIGFLLTSDLLDFCLWAQYHITYISSFNSLKEHVQCYRESFSAQVDQLGKQVDKLTQKLSQTLMEHFKTDIKPFMDEMMTKKWLKTDEDFNEVVSRIENFSGLCKSTRAPSAQILVNDMHYDIARGYVSQLMKKKYSCKKSKSYEAAIKIREQWSELKKLFQEMGSSLNWLYPLGDYLSDIIGMENDKNIKDLLIPLVNNFPDISKKQLSAVLYFRENGLSFERHNVINQFSVLKHDIENTNHGHSFFSDIE